MLAAFAGSLAVGDALDATTQIGPMASKTHRDRVEGYIAKGKSEGARLVAGGGRPGELDRGWFVAADDLRRRRQPARRSPARRSSARCCR